VAIPYAGRKSETSSENKAHLELSLLHGTCRWCINLVSFHMNGVFFDQNIIFYFDGIKVLL
jgi:hypothetical protein